MSVRGRLAAAFAVAVISLSGCSSFWGSHSTSSLSNSSAASSTSAMLRVADALVADGQYSQALPLLRVVHRRQPTNVRILVRLGQALSGMGAYLEAVSVFDKAYRIDSHNVEVARSMGFARIGLRRPDLALPHFELAHNLAPNDPETISGLGLAQIGIGAFGPGLASFEEGLLANPDHKALKSNYGLSLSLVGDHERAIELLTEIALAPGATAKDRQNLALAYGLSGDRKKASKLSHIDLDAQSARNNVTFFKELSAMGPRARIAVLIGASPNPEQTIRHMANDAFPQKDAAAEKDAQLATARLLDTGEEPIMVAEIAQVLETIEPEIGIPEPEESIEALDDGTLVPILLGPKGYALQIAAYRSAEELLPGWEILRKQYTDLIQDLPPRRSEIDYGPKEGHITGFYYRLNAGPLTDYEQARAICKEIRTRGGDCWVRPPEIAELETPADSTAASIEALPEPVMEPQPEATVDVEPSAPMAEIVPADAEAMPAVTPTPAQATDETIDESAAEATTDAAAASTPDSKTENPVWLPVSTLPERSGEPKQDFHATGSTITKTKSGRPGVPAGIIVSAAPKASKEGMTEEAEAAEPNDADEGSPALDDVGLAD